MTANHLIDVRSRHINLVKNLARKEKKGTAFGDVPIYI